MKALSLILLLAGCATLDEADTTFVPVTERTLALTVTVVEHPEIFCGRKLGFTAMGCTRWSGDFSRCTIYVPKETWHQVLGHELDHCLRGGYHP